MSFLDMLLGNKPNKAYELIAQQTRDSSLILDLERIETTHNELEKALLEVRAEAQRVKEALTSDIERAKHRISVICDTLIEPLIMVNYMGDIISGNQSAEEVFGQSSIDLSKLNICNLFCSEDATGRQLQEESKSFIDYVQNKNVQDTMLLYKNYLADGKSRLNTVNFAKFFNKERQVQTRIQYVINILNTDVTKFDSVVYIISINPVSDRILNTDLASSLFEFQQRVLSAVPNPLFYMDSNLKILGANEAFASLVKQPRAHLVGRAISELFEEETSIKLYEILSELIASNTSDVQTHDINLILLDQSPLHTMAMYCTTLRSDIGTFTGVMITFTNGHDLEALKEFRDQIFQSIPIPVFYKDSGFAYVNVNQPFADWFGVELGEILGKTRDQVSKSWAYVKEPGIEQLLRQLHENDEQLAKSDSCLRVVEHDVFNVKLGEIRKVRFYTAPITDCKNTFSGVIGSMVDVTESIDIASGRGLLFESLPIPVSLYGTNCVYLDCNQAFAELLNISKDDIVGKLCSDSPFKYYEPSMVQNSAKALGKHTMVFEFSLPKTDTQTQSKKVIVFKSPLADEAGHFMGILNIYFDIDKYTKSACKDSK